MKNIFSKEEFLNEKNNVKIDSVNEGLFKWLKDQFKNMFNEADKKVKESKEINPKIETAKKNIDALFIKKVDELKTLIGSTTTPTNSSTTQADLGTGESAIYNTYIDKLNEADAITTSATTQTIGELTDDAAKKSNDPNNPIEVSIKMERTNLEKSLKSYLESENRLVKDLTNAKLSEYDSYVEGKRLEIYQKFTGPVAQKMATDEQKKIETANANIKKLMANLGNAAGVHDGDIFEYKNKDGYKNLIMITKTEKDSNGKVTKFEAKTIFKFAVTPEDIKNNDKLKERNNIVVKQEEFVSQQAFTPNVNGFDKNNPMNKELVLSTYNGIIDDAAWEEIYKYRKDFINKNTTTPKV